MNTKQIIGIAILAGAGFLFYSNYQKQKAAEERLRQLQEQYRNQNIPSNTPDWYKWINLIITLLGTGAQLWEEGGPFYKQGVPDPRTDPAGWAKILSQTRFIP